MLALCISAGLLSPADAQHAKPRKDADLIDLVGLPRLPLEDPVVVSPAPRERRQVVMPAVTMPPVAVVPPVATVRSAPRNVVVAPIAPRLQPAAVVIAAPPAPVVPAPPTLSQITPEPATGLDAGIGATAQQERPEVLADLRAPLAVAPISPTPNPPELAAIAPLEARAPVAAPPSPPPSPPLRPRERVAASAPADPLTTGSTASAPTDAPVAPAPAIRQPLPPPSRPRIVTTALAAPPAEIVAQEDYTSAVPLGRPPRAVPKEWEVPRATRASGRPALDRAAGNAGPALPATKIMYYVRAQPLDALLRELGQIAGVRIVPGPGVRGTVRDRRLEGPANVVIDRVARENALFWFSDGVSVFMDPLDDQKTRSFKVRGASSDQIDNALETAGLARYRDRIQPGGEGMVRATGPESFLRSVEAALSGADSDRASGVQLIKFGQRAP